MPLPVLQKVLGHSSIRTTALYWKNSEDPREKVITDQWLSGKLPKEPPKSIENKPQELPKLPIKEINWEINLFIENKTRNSQQEFLTTENKLLQEKVRQLEQAKKEQEQIIINLKNDKEKLTKQLIQTQQEKDTLLKMLSNDLKQQQALTQLDNNKQDNNQELHQQLVAQIEIKFK